MKYEKNNYIGKQIQLWPGDYVSKWGEILNVDDLGWQIKITKMSHQGDIYEVGDVIFISHSKNFIFTFV